MLLELARSTAAEWDSWIQYLCQFEADVLHIERVSFWSLAERNASMRCDAGYVASTRVFEHGAVLLASEVPAFFDAIREARTLNVEDIRGDSRVRGLEEYCSSRGISSMLDVPVWIEGRVAGVLCHEQVGPARRWSGDEQEFAVGVGQVVASALTARAHTRAEAAARRSSFLDTVSRAVIASLDTREIASRAMALIVPGLADASILWMTNHYGRLECLGWSACDPRTRAALASWDRERRPDREGPFARRVLHQRQSVLVPDVHRAVEALDLTADERASLERLGVSAAIGVPFEVGGKAFGAMVLCSVSRHFDAEDRSLAEDIAARLAAALQNARMYGVAQDALRGRDDFLALAAHELRAPLTAMQLRIAKLVKYGRRQGNADDLKQAGEIADDVRRFDELIEHLLETARLRADGLKLAPYRCDLSHIVERCVARMADRAERAGTPIATRIEPAIVGMFDCAHIERAVLCLLDNAIKFGNRQPVDVSLRRDGLQVELTVRDRGAGIAPDQLPLIFEPFERAVSRQHFGGLGVGLYIAKAVVDAHGGTIATSSPPGGGTIFALRLPLLCPSRS
ncbi:MAG TPA: GAF domain-containing sensor histidine kinase [Polyangiaceae bacterium]